MNIELTSEMLALIPAVALIIQLVKNLDFYKDIKKWTPFVSMGIALGLCYLTKVPDPILPAIAIGLAASGAYSSVKAINGGQ